jgi:simple sugar transport system permease protein
VHANLSHRVQINTFVVGLVLNSLMLGLTSFLIAIANFDDHQVSQVRIPGLAGLSIIGPLFNQRWPLYLLLLLVPGTWWLVERSRWGLELRAIADNPQAADVTGLKVNKLRRQALLYCGVLSGLGGAYLATAEVGSFNANMTAGRGYIVIAAVIFGAWRLKGTLIGCLVFGFADALRLALPALGFELNSQLLVAAPYLMALIAMLLFAKKSREPRALGKPFVRGIT